VSLYTLREHNVQLALACESNILLVHGGNGYESRQNSLLCVFVGYQSFGGLS